MTLFTTALSVVKLCTHSYNATKPIRQLLHYEGMYPCSTQTQWTRGQKTKVEGIAMLKAQSFLTLLILGLGELLLLQTGEAVIYYVSQTGSNDTLCPATEELCNTLDYYVTNAVSKGYFNSDKSNITMMFLRGSHGFNTTNNSLYISNLENFSMIGSGPTANTIVCFVAHFANVSAVHIENITVNNCPRSIIEANRGPLRMSLLRTDFKQTKFSISDVSTFNIVFEESRFIVLASVWFEFTENIYRNDSNVRLSGCTFDLAKFQMTITNGNVSIQDSTFNTTDFSIQSSNTTIVLSGNVHFQINKLTAIAASLSTVNISGNVSFIKHADTAIALYSDSTINFLGTSNVIFVNNTGTNGGALAFYSSTLNLYQNSNVTFYNNSAQVVGGAIYVDGNYMFNPIKTPECFYQLVDYNPNTNNNTYSMIFVNNTAKRGGEHIYGAYVFSACSVAYTPDTDGEEQWPLGSYQVADIFKFYPRFNSSFSSSSSEPARVCICGPTGQPNCTNISTIFNEMSVYPGETFNISAVIVGADFGTTVGTIRANFLPTNTLESALLHPPYQYGQLVNNHRKCANLSYTIFSKSSSKVLYLTTTDITLGIATKYKQSPDIRNYLKEYIRDFNTVHVIEGDLLTTPVFIDVTLLPCPPGFSLTADAGCDCYRVLSDNGVKCQFTNGKGYLSWDSTIWFDKLSNSTNQGVTIAYYCPTGYCNSSKELNVNIEDDSDSQCAFNRAGRLCGGCKENYSLAIGSSHCIQCPNNNNLALLIFFAAAGFLLVFFITVFNLTVTQGMINGLIFYANIVWTYQGILFTQQVETNKFFIFLKTFIAWLNLDFGIQTCFVNGLNAYWKTWLQYIFPLYIWSIVALIIIGARRSTKITNLLGSKAVPVLATLFLLSYSKLLRTIIASMQYMPLHYYLNESESAVETKLVWFLDGRYVYCHFPHALLFIAALAALLCIWLPYTLQLFLIQGLRRIPSYRLSRLMSRFDPVYDAYFAPLKDKHRYWFGLLLLVRGILLAIFTFVYPIAPNLSLFLVQIFAAFLLCYANFKSVYKRKSVQIIENMFLINLIIVAGTPLIGEEQKTVGVYTSIAITFTVFMGILLWNIYHILHERINSRFKLISNTNYMHSNYNQQSSHSDFEEVTVQVSESVHYRDSILDDENRPISPKIKTNSANYKSTGTTTSYV